MSKSTEYKNQYIAENYDRINLTVPKGTKVQLEQKAKAVGKSVNGFLNDLVRAALDDAAARQSIAKDSAKKTTSVAAKEKPKEKVNDKAKDKVKEKEMDIFLF